MTTELIYDVYHIDGPPFYGFAIAEHPDGSGQRVEIRYRTLRYAGTKQECEDAYKWLMNLILSELDDLQKIQVKDLGSHKIIWWRHRVDYEQSKDDSNRWRFYCRLATTPPLPDIFWEQWETPEGSLNRNAREVCG
jgi:hypothetical protein